MQSMKKTSGKSVSKWIGNVSKWIGNASKWIGNVSKWNGNGFPMIGNISWNASRFQLETCLNIKERICCVCCPSLIFPLSNCPPLLCPGGVPIPLWDWWVSFFVHNVAGFVHLSLFVSLSLVISPLSVFGPKFGSLSLLATPAGTDFIIRRYWWQALQISFRPYVKSELPQVTPIYQTVRLSKTLP